MDPNEVTALDPKFYERADAHIHHSNAQMADINAGKVSASMMYATARFNAYVSWIGCPDSEDIDASREEIIRFFVEQYRAMLEGNLDDYIQNFDRYLATPGGTHPDDAK